MKRKFVVCWNLVVTIALVAGVMLWGKPALAGYWEEVPNPAIMWGPSEDVEPSDYKTGTLSISGENYSPDGLTSVPFSYSHTLDPWMPMPMYPYDTIGGHLQIELNTSERTMFRWVRDFDWETWEPDPNDNPPDVLNLLVHYGVAGTAASDTYLTNHDPDKEFVRVSVLGRSIDSQDGKTDPGEFVTAYDTTGAISGKRLFQVKTHGQELVPAPWVEFSATVGLLGGRFVNQNGSYTEPFEGWAEPMTGYGAQPDSRIVNWSALPHESWFDIKTISPTNTTFDAWVSRGWKDDGGPETPLVAFYQGRGSYSLTVSRDGQPVTLNNYQWSVSPQTFVPQLPIPTPSELDQMMPGASTSSKNFHWDFGHNIAAFPIDAVVNVTATDPSDGAQVSAQATIHYHSPWEGVDTSAGPNEPPFIILPPGTMVETPPHLDENGQPVPGGQTPVGDLKPGDKIKIPDKPLTRIVTAVTPQPDGTYKVSYGLDPDDNPDDPAYDLNQQIERAQDAYQEAIKQGATGVKYGLEGYKAVAEFYAYGPLYELGGAALGQLGPKALELLQSGVKAEEAAAKLRGMAGLQRTLVARVRQLLGQGGHTAEEIAQLEAKAKQLEAVAQKLEAGASEAESLAAHAGDLAGGTQEAVSFAQQGTQRFSQQDFALGVFEHLQSFKGQAKIGSEMSQAYPNLPFFEGICQGIDDAVAAGGKIRFNLDGVNVKAALDPNSIDLVQGTSQRIYDKVISQELRYVLQSHPGAVVFYRNGVVVPTPSFP